MNIGGHADEIYLDDITFTKRVAAARAGSPTSARNSDADAGARTSATPRLRPARPRRTHRSQPRSSARRPPAHTRRREECRRSRTCGSGRAARRSATAPPRARLRRSAPAPRDPGRNRHPHQIDQSVVAELGPCSASMFPVASRLRTRSSPERSSSSSRTPGITRPCRRGRQRGSAAPYAARNGSTLDQRRMAVENSLGYLRVREPGRRHPLEVHGPRRVSRGRPPRARTRRRVPLVRIVPSMSHNSTTGEAIIPVRAPDRRSARVSPPRPDA